jgi:hypothetical protein
MTQSPSSLNKKYTLQGTLKGHRSAILCLRVSDDGKILASGGTYPNSVPTHLLKCPQEWMA